MRGASLQASNRRIAKRINKNQSQGKTAGQQRAQHTHMANHPKPSNERIYIYIYIYAEPTE